MIDRFFANTGKLFPCFYKPATLGALSKRAPNVEAAQFCVPHLIMPFATTHGTSEVYIKTGMEQVDTFLQRSLSFIPGIALVVDNPESSTPFHLVVA